MTRDTPPTETDPPDDLTEMLRGDQRLRWQQGQRVLVEAYFEHYPELRERPEAVRELILNELRLRCELGDAIELADLRGRFPSEDAWLAEQYERLRPSQSREDTSQADDDDSPLANWPVLPGYEILQEIGRGGMGAVYKAWQQRLGRPVALKALLAGVHASPRARSRFRHEAEAVAQLQHPYIVQLFDVIEHDGQLFLAMEYVGGGSLARKTRGIAQPAMQAAEYVRKLAKAMQFAHERGIIHRDLKPSNVLLTEDSIPKLSDFGLAKRLDDDTSQTKSGTVLGTPDYMAPEQADGRVHEVGPPADIYSLGAILYELLTGQPPFRGEALVRVLDAVRFRKPRPTSNICSDVPRDVEAICLKCLEKHPADRYASAGALADDLTRFLKNEPVRGAPVGTWSRFRAWLGL